MAPIERTAYPRFKKVVSLRELHEAFTPTPAETAWATEANLLVLVVLLNQKRIYSDKKSGATMDRPGLIEVFDCLRPGDVPVVYTLDRLGRTVRDVLNQIHNLSGAGIRIRTLADTIPIDTSKPGDAMSELAIVLLSLFAQMERTYASERAGHARAVREEKSLRTGRKIASNTAQHLEWARHLREVDPLTMAEITAKTGIPRTSLYRHFLRMDNSAASAG